MVPGQEVDQRKLGDCGKRLSGRDRIPRIVTDAGANKG